jgi:hypothetical protein
MHMTSIETTPSAAGQPLPRVHRSVRRCAEVFAHHRRNGFNNSTPGGCSASRSTLSFRRSEACSC